ncbi:hypothetical protein QSG27_24490, partial [Azospirillum sp. C340-1]|nr:hypothetical protein [Azospirillum isscasi]
MHDTDRTDGAETALRALPGVLDACVLARGPDGRRVGYVTLRDGAALPPADGVGLTALLRINRMPRTADGAIDRTALARVPVWDDALSAAWRDRLTATPGIADAAVLVQPAAPTRPRLHLADLLPDHAETEEAQDGGGNHPAHTHAAHTHAAHAVRATIGQPLSDRPALSRGPDLAPDPAFPWTLAAALDRAAGTAGARLVHVADDFTETVESYAALRDRALRALGGLRGLGLERGERPA